MMRRKPVHTEGENTTVFTFGQCMGTRTEETDIVFRQVYARRLTIDGKVCIVLSYVTWN